MQKGLTGGKCESECVQMEREWDNSTICASFPKKFLFSSASRLGHRQIRIAIRERVVTWIPDGAVVLLGWSVSPQAHSAQPSVLIHTLTKVKGVESGD